MNNFKSKILNISRTKKGYPYMWESLKEFNNVQKTTVLINENIEFKTSIPTNIKKIKNNEYTSAIQSLVPIEENDYIIKVYKDSEGIGVTILKIIKIFNYPNKIEVLPVYRKNPKDNILHDISEQFLDVVNQTIDKVIKMDFDFTLNKHINKN